jgi:hypothetical protein
MLAMADQIAFVPEEAVTEQRCDISKYHGQQLAQINAAFAGTARITQPASRQMANRSGRSLAYTSVSTAMPLTLPPTAS